jgi:hypothetical protein
MSFYNMAAAATEHMIVRFLRRALLAIIVAVFAIVAIYHFTIAGMIVLETRFGDLHAQLIVAAIFAALSALTITILWATGGQKAKPRAPTLSQPRETQLVMLLEAAMLGFELARKGTRSR